MAVLICDCSIEIYDSDFPARILRQGRFRARKERKCCECGKIIRRGEEYWMQHIIYPCGHRVYFTCVPCFSIRMDYCGSGYIFAELADQIKDCLGFDYREVPKKNKE